MAVRMVVRVDAPRAHPDRLTVRDAFEHVLDLFDLATFGDDDSASKAIEWRLVTASMQSPLTVVAEAISTIPGMDIEAVARRQSAQFVRNYDQLKKGHVPPAWTTGGARAKAKSVLTRNRKGIGRTSIEVDQPDNTVEIVDLTEDEAQIAVLALGGAANEPSSKGKEQIGSLEGTLVHVGTYYNQPAIALRERKSSTEVWCTIPDEFRGQIANEANFQDVWSGRRVRVRGRIIYDRAGNISRVYATEIHRIDVPRVQVTSIQDPRFTDGLSVAEYLEKLREGDLG